MSIKKFLLASSLAFFLLNLLLKFVFITSIPPILTNDELYYATEAKALIATGSDVFGQWRPWHFAPANPIYAELTGTTTALGFLLFPHSVLLATKFIPAVLGSILPILLGLITFRFTKSKTAFFVTAFVATCNPWIFQFSRMGFDSFFSVNLYVFGIVFLLYLKGWKTLLSLPIFILGFYQYQGHKPLLLPLVLLTVCFLYYEEHKSYYLKPSKMKPFLPHIALVFSLLLMVVLYVEYLPHTNAGGRIGETIFSGFGTSAEQVNTERRLTFANPISQFFDNKYLTYMNGVLEKFFNSFNIRWLFSHGNDNVDTFAVTKFGFLYAIDSLLICIAVCVSLLKKIYLKITFFCLGIVLVGTIPNILKNENLWLTFRGAFMIIGLVLLAGLGLYFVLKTKKYFLITAFFGVYLLSSIFFFYHYFLQYPLKTTKDIFFYNRVVASYVFRRSQTPVIIYSSAPRQVFDSILTYNNLITGDLMHELKTAYQNKSYSLQNVTIRGGCFDKSILGDPNQIVFVDYKTQPCEETKKAKDDPAQLVPPIHISSIIDSGSVYTIYSDSLCNSVPLDHYTHVEKNVFNVEKLDTYSFCKSFFTKEL